LSLVLVVGAAAYFVPQYWNPRPVPPLGGDAAPAVAAAPSPSPTLPANRLIEAGEEMANGRWSTAAAIYGETARANPSMAAAHAGWARALVYANKAAEAIPHAQRAVELEPRSAEYQALLALTFDWSSNPDRAITSARRAIELDSKLPEGHAYLAEAFTDKFRMKEASEALDRAAAAGRENPEVLRVQAYYLESNADYAGAVDL
jgi:tetratricopeptide (TPR) repeat protein